VELVRRSPRFGILLASMVLAMAMTGLDIAASIHNFIGGTDGINPWWKLSLVFKCLTDTIVLDDFKTELKRLGIRRIQKEEKRRQSTALVLDDKDDDQDDGRELEFADALNVTDSTAAGGKGSKKRKRMRQESVSGGGSERRTWGKGGVRIGRLPGLKVSGFGRKQKQDDEEGEVQGRTEPELVRREMEETQPSTTQQGQLSANHERQQGKQKQSDGDGDSLDFQTRPAGF